MFENRKASKTLINQVNNPKNQPKQYSHNKDKNIPIFSKKSSFEHREFGNNLTNITLTALEKGCINSNKSILRAIELIKVKAKDKERSREKSLQKNIEQNCAKNSQINGKNEKKRPSENMALKINREGKRVKIRNNKLKKDENSSTNSSTIITNSNDENNSLINNKNVININIVPRENNEVKIPKEQNLDKNISTNFQLDNNSLISRKGITQNSSSDENIPIINRTNLQYVDEYQEEIIEYLLSLEEKKRINANYMFNQRDINEKMRIILIDWLIEVHLKFKLLPETLFLTINYIDRYLQKNQITRDKLQLLAVSSLLIACKYEEIYPPELSSFVYITDNAYQKEDILNYEIKILDALEYDMTYPSSYRYLEILIIKLGLINNEQFFYKMQYLLELSLSKLYFYNYTYLELVIACCLFLFENDDLMKQNVINCFHLYDNSEKLLKIKNCQIEINKLLDDINLNKGAFKGVRQKFSLEKFGEVAKTSFFK